MTHNPWEALLVRLRAEIPDEDFRRWFGATAYASDAGDQLTVWVPTEGIRRHIMTHFREQLDRALQAIDRGDTHLRLVVSGIAEDEDEDG